MEPLKVMKYVTVELSEVKLTRGSYIQVHAMNHTIEVKLRDNGDVVVCVKDISVVKTFDEEYGN